MQVTPRELPMSQEPTGGPATPTFNALAERLGDGPLRTLVTLHVRAGTLAPVAAVDDLEQSVRRPMRAPARGREADELRAPVARVSSRLGVALQSSGRRIQAVSKAAH